jgi:hypothetical protein
MVRRNQGDGAEKNQRQVVILCFNAQADKRSEDGVRYAAFG